ncbi:hypothetical protein [Roseofilum capinflatum]|uniref:Lipoprotein n=1 Tax=Roseofilum capinflatum BLCC-M114 TaxID=3022440 RepID=A0ABT7B7S0_9CYAN|nr:hypothetical protein [Roseofilum capinflatum]MDJ1174338.1 hypothetical protein [Roseofilum capinflatum BLCC-M114]
MNTGVVKYQNLPLPPVTMLKIIFTNPIRVVGLLMLLVPIVQGCGAFEQELEFPATRLKVQLTELPSSDTNLDNAELITYAEAKPLRKNRNRIRIPEASDDQTAVVMAKINNEIKLIDFFVPEVNEEPELNFASTARSLVFMNPLFIGIPFEKRVSIFEAIDQNEKFQDLVQVVAQSNSIVDDKVVELSTDIAIELAQFYLKSDISPIQFSNSANPNSNTSNSNYRPNLFNITDFPQNACGDSLPITESSYPVKLYPVYIDYSENNLQAVKSNFCRDAFVKKRKNTNKQAVQVASFLTIDRANEFKQFMIEQLGSGDVGEPTIIENKPRSESNQINQLLSSLKAGDFFDVLIPAAHAQSPLDYRDFYLTHQFRHDGKVRPSFSPLALVHEMTLNAEKQGMRLKGTSFLAQQVVIIRAEHLFTDLKADDYNGNESHEKFVVAEFFIEPAQLGVWDLMAIQTIGSSSIGQEQINTIISPKKQKVWPPGDYIALMSGSRFLNRRTPDQPYGAFDMNIAIFLVDLLNITTGYSAEKQWTDIASLVGQVLIGCSTNESFSQTLKCLSSQDNSVKLFEALGGESEEIIKGLLQFQGESAEQLAKKIAKAVNAFDKGISVSRHALLGNYLASFTLDGPYFAKFKVTQPPPDPALLELVEVTDVNNLETIILDCSKEPAGSFIDLEFEACRGNFTNLRIDYKNYSNDWYEISWFYTDDHLDELNDRTFGLFSNDLLKEQGDKLNIVLIPPGGDASVATITNRLQIKRYSSKPSRTIQMKCNGNPIKIWGALVESKCTSKGTYASVEAYVERPIKLLVGDDILMLEPRFLSSDDATLTSTGKTVTFTLSVP